MAKMVTKNMVWNKVVWTCFDASGHKYIDEYTGCEDLRTPLKALEFWYKVNETEEDIKDYRPCFVDVMHEEGIRGMTVDDFIRLGQRIPEDASRKGLITRTITLYAWKIYKVGDDDELTATGVIVNEEMTKKQIVKEYDADMAKLVGKEEILIGMDVETFFQNSVTVDR